MNDTPKAAEKLPCPIKGCTTPIDTDVFDHLPQIHGDVGVQILAGLARLLRDEVPDELAELTLSRIASHRYCAGMPLAARSVEA